MSLEDYGWNSRWAEECRTDLTEASRARPGAEPARVLFASREHYRVRTADETLGAALAGRLRERGEQPVVGDWVVIERPTPDADEVRMIRLLPRRSKLSRRDAGKTTREQVVAANVDTAFLTMGLDGNFNLRRLERLLIMTREGRVAPVCLLTKADLAQDLAARVTAVRAVSAGAPVHAVSSLHGWGLEPLAAYLDPGRTVALVGSSGVGKSTLLNRLCGGERMRTGSVRERDDRGRHTTSHRELVRLPKGGLLIDNPGIRELEPWVADESGLAGSFADIGARAADCRFRDCTHRDEPGCAVRQAVEAGTLAEDRLASLRSLEREQRYQALRRDEATRRRGERRQGALYKRIQREKRWRRE